MKLRISIVFLIVTLAATGQDLPDLTNYQHNWMIFNPAFAGSRDALSSSLFFKDNAILDPSRPAPKYGQVSIHSPFKKASENSWGFSYFNKKEPGMGTLGINFSDPALYVEHNVAGYYSHKIKLGGGQLSMGLSAIISLESVDNSVLDIRQNPDPNFMVDMEPVLLANFSAGALYYNSDFFAGLSVPRLARSITLIDGNNYSEVSSGDTTGTGTVSIGESSFIADYNFMLAGGRQFELSSNLTLYPSILAGYVPSVGFKGINYMAGMNVGLLGEKLWFGTIYKSSNAFSINMNIEIMNSNLLIGLSYDFPLSSQAGYFDNAFEIVLRYDNIKRVVTKAPFYF